MYTKLTAAAQASDRPTILLSLVSISRTIYRYILSYDFLSAVNRSQIAYDIADIIKDARRLWDDSTTDVRNRRGSVLQLSRGSKNRANYAAKVDKSCNWSATTVGCRTALQFRTGVLRQPCETERFFSK